MTACIQRDNTLTCEDFRELTSRTWRGVEILTVNRLSSGVNLKKFPALKKFKVTHSLVRCDDISGSEGIAVELEDEVCSMSSSVSQEVVSTTRSQPEVEATNAIVGIITGGVIGIVLVIGFIAFLVIRRKKEPRQNDVEIISLDSLCDSVVFERQKIA